MGCGTKPYCLELGESALKKLTKFLAHFFCGGGEDLTQDFPVDLEPVLELALKIRLTLNS